MKSIKYIALLSFLTLMINCREEVPAYNEQTDSKEGVQIFLGGANTPKNLTIYPLQDTRTVQFGAGYGGVGLPAKDIQVTLGVDQKAFDSINKSRIASGGTAYDKFPDGSYTLDKLSATIPAGKLDSDLFTLTYKPKSFDKAKDYILPVSLMDASGYKISTVKTLVLTVPKFNPPYTELSRTGWTATADSEQGGGLEKTGLASAVLDNDLTTIWHTQWSGATPKFPHWLAIDMKQPNYVGQIGLIKRQGNNRGPNAFYVEASTNGTTWTKVLDTTAMDPNLDAEQKFKLTSPGVYRYLKVTFTSGVDFYAFLSEFKAYTTAPEFQ